MWNTCGPFKGCSSMSPNWAPEYLLKDDYKAGPYPTAIKNGDTAGWTMSKDQANWGPVNQIGAILGFGVFGLMYAYTVISIFLDIAKSGREYQAMVDDDI